MKTRFGIVLSLSLGLLSAGAAHASDAVLGAVIGGGLGAVVGNQVGGRDGAVIGGAVGAATGAIIASDDDRHHRRTYYYAPPRYYAPPPRYSGLRPEVQLMLLAGAILGLIIGGFIAVSLRGRGTAAPATPARRGGGGGGGGGGRPPARTRGRA